MAIKEVVDSAGAIVKGLGITLKEMMQPTVTEDYPDVPPVFQERFRGKHVLQRDDSGLEKCVACFLCAAACPVECIYIEAAENTEKARISGGERYASVYNIDYSRCIFCGYCVEACPTDAITHGHGFELAAYDTAALIMRKEDMLVPLPANAKPVLIEPGRASALNCLSEPLSSAPEPSAPGPPCTSSAPEPESCSQIPGDRAIPDPRPVTRPA
jgi:NADH-quinone oxidoreductase subunit I